MCSSWYWYRFEQRHKWNHLKPYSRNFTSTTVIPCFSRIFWLVWSLTYNDWTRSPSIETSSRGNYCSWNWGTRLYSASRNWRDYLPIFRYTRFSGKNASVLGFQMRCDIYMNKLLARLEPEIQNGSEISSITGDILDDPEAIPNERSDL
jgi:hypothetical protein